MMSSTISPVIIFVRWCRQIKLNALAYHVAPVATFGVTKLPQQFYEKSRIKHITADVEAVRDLQVIAGNVFF